MAHGSGRTSGGDDDERVGNFVDFLTFTETRFILVRTHLNSDGSFDHAWHHRGTWEITDDEIVRSWYHDHDEEEATLDRPTRLRKSYILATDDDLLVTHWADETGEDSGLDWMTRVSDPSLSLPPLGTWVEEFTDDNSGDLEIFTMTLEPDGMFTWSDEYPDGTWTLRAEWELDLDNYFINLKKR